ncbi:MAG TPA: acetone carboxylase subunit gamma [Sulfobacillus sp.]|nr:acetone carboxylase subunit gamma [Sulfobacillus sp.]
MANDDENKKTVQALISGELPWAEMKDLMSGTKDPERFRVVRSILQSMVPFPEKILLPLTPHLFIVQKQSERIVKCDCGYEFGDYRTNWKYFSRVRVRDSEESLKSLYHPDQGVDPQWMELREFYCPGCFRLLETEAVPPGSPVVFDFQPDLDSFYRIWLKEPLD